VSVAYVVTLERAPTGELTGARIGVPLVDQYLAYLALVGRAATIWSSYAYDLAVFCRWLAADQPGVPVVDALRRLTGAQVFAFVERELRPSDGRRPLAVGTVYRRVVALAKCFDWAGAAGRVDRNPVPRDRRRGAFGRTVARPAFLRVPALLPRPAPADELAAFAGTLRTWRDRALVGLLVGAGLRLSEALGLRLGDLDWGGKRVFVRRGKGGHQRYAMAADPAWAALKAYLEDERPEPVADGSAADAPVFVVLHGPRRGRPLTAAGVQSLLRHHRRLAAAPNVTPHRLRHTCGTELHRAGMTLELLQEQLGHRRLDSTRRYVHLSNERLRAAYRTVAPRLYHPPGPEETDR
jgi:integrase/recombinase XerD